MKTVHQPYLALVLAVLAAAFLFSAGCTSDPGKIPGGQAATGTAAAVTAAATGSPSLPYGVSVTVPATWTRKDVMTSGTTDYGRTATTIARFTSPVTIPGDAASYNTLTVDIDQNPGSDFEDYFNKATLAVEKTYGTQLDSHSIVKSGTVTISGYKTYEVDFQTAEVKGSYFFTRTDKGMYIFAFKGPYKPVPVHTLEGEIVDICKSITITP